MERLKKMLEGHSIRIMFTEGWDPRILRAARRLLDEHVLIPVLNGSRKDIEAAAKNQGISLRHIEMIDQVNYDRMEEMILRMVELRKGKLSSMECENLLKQPNYFATMCLAMGDVDGLLGGAAISTRDTLRAALQLIKTKQGCDIVSSCFLMIRGQERYIMGDCSLNIDPSADELVDITMQCANTATVFGIEPNVGLLSYSTFGSGAGCSVDKVKEAVRRLKRLPLPYEVDGEMQLDTAVVQEVADLKAPNCRIGGKVNTFIFPSLDAGNIGYKLLARFGGFEAVGPILQGMRKPLNDLSRGANEDEIYKMAIVTAAQRLMIDEA
ncbi:MAG: phosphate acetyltransferase [Erysipelotrichaceae bacterium]|nr:phosphate acetyltransferase [Erysipelotrichaceae bacterium]